MNVMEKMDRGQLVKIAVLAIIVLVVIWQIYGMFSNSNSSLPMKPKSSQGTAALKTESILVKPANLIPKPSDQPLTEREKQLIKLQQETNAKYLVALSDLQMLKLNLQIAELNRSITRARLDTAKDEKKLVELIEGPSTPQFGQPIVTSSVKSTAPTTASTAVAVSQVQSEQHPQLPQFAVISVSKLQGKWTAVLTIQGKLRVVNVGDELANDQGKIIKIDKAGVVVQNGKETIRVNIVTTI